MSWSQWKPKPKTIAGTPLAKLSTQVAYGLVGSSVLIGMAMYMLLNDNTKQKFQVSENNYSKEEQQVLNEMKMRKLLPYRPREQVEADEDNAREYKRFA